LFRSLFRLQLVHFSQESAVTRVAQSLTNGQGAASIVLFLFYFTSLHFQSTFPRRFYPRLAANWPSLVWSSIWCCFSVGFSVCFGRPKPPLRLQFWVTWHLSNAFVCFSLAFPLLFLCFFHAYLPDGRRSVFGCTWGSVIWVVCECVCFVWLN